MRCFLTASLPSTSMEPASDTESDSPESVTRVTMERTSTFHKANPGFHIPEPPFAAVRRAIEVLSEKDIISIFEVLCI